MSVVEVATMTTLERMQAMELLWDALSHEEKEIESPAWHEEILRRRKERIESGEAKFITLEQLKDHYRK